MSHLAHKGYRSTRLQIVIGAWASATVFLVAAQIDAAQWVDLTKWLIGIYAGSEVGAKASVAVAGKQQ